MATREDFEDERRRARRVRLIVDITCAWIAQERPDRQVAQRLVETARAQILELFPGSDETYEIVYARRFNRFLEEFTRPATDPPSDRVVAFPARSSSR